VFCRLGTTARSFVQKAATSSPISTRTGRRDTFAGVGQADLTAELIALVLVVIRLIAAGAFLASSYSKLRDLPGAEIALLDYRLVPAAVARPVATALAIAELGAGVLLVLGVPIGSALGLVLLAFFMAAIGSALLRHLDISCHCVEEDEPIGWPTLIRNGVLMLGLSADTVGRASTRLVAATLDEPLERVIAAALLIATGVAAYGVISVIKVRQPRRVGGSNT